MFSQWQLHYQGLINSLHLPVYYRKIASAHGGYVFLRQLMSEVTADTPTHTRLCRRIPCIQGNLWVYAFSLAALSIIKAYPT